MNRKLSFSVDDESNDVVKRYEQFLEGKATGYFDVEELETIVEFYLRKGRTKDCTTAVDLGLQLHPNNNALRTKRAKIYLATGDFQKAFKILDTLTETSDYEVVLLKVEVLVRLERVKEAEALSDSVLSGTPDDLDNLCLEVAFVYLTLGEFNSAQKYLQMGDKFNRKNLDLLFELAFCYEQNNQYDIAIETYNRIIDVDPFMDEAWFNLGQIYFAKFDFVNALKAYDYALTINDTDSLTCLQKAHVHFQLDDFENAIEAYKEYKLMTDDTWQPDLFIGECYEKLEKYDESIIYYKQSLVDQPKNFEALTGIGICLLEKEEYEESLVYILRALEMNDQAADAWVYLAEAYVGLDENNQALMAYLRSIALEPIQADTMMAVANIYLENGEFETAIEYYLTAQAQDDELEYIDLFLSVAYFKTGEKLKSLSCLQKANELSDAAAGMFLELCPEAVSLLDEDINLDS